MIFTEQGMNARREEEEEEEKGVDVEGAAATTTSKGGVSPRFSRLLPAARQQSPRPVDGQRRALLLRIAETAALERSICCETAQGN